MDWHQFTNDDIRLHLKGSGYHCKGCKLEEYPQFTDFWTVTADAMVTHLLAHQALGHKVPSWVLWDLTDQAER